MVNTAQNGPDATGAGPGGGGAGRGGPNWPYQPPSPEQNAPTAHVARAGPLPSRPATSYEHPPIEPPPRRPVGLLIGVGGLLAIAAIIGTIALWPNQVPASTLEPLPTQQSTEQDVGPATTTVAPDTHSNVPPSVTTTQPTTTTTTSSKTTAASLPALPVP